jgi:hypothetical protein
MACCGDGRRRTAPTGSVAGGRPNEPVTFEWGGPGHLTIFGRSTGIRYHFAGPGARARIDLRDAPLLEIVRGLRIVQSTPR